MLQRYARARRADVFSRTFAVDMANRTLLSDVEQMLGDLLRLLRLSSPHGLHWLFQAVFPEVEVHVQRSPSIRTLEVTRTRVASSDWWASRQVVSITSSGWCSRTALANAAGPCASKSCRQPSGGAPAGTAGTSGTMLAGGSAVPSGVMGPLTITSPRNLSSRMPRLRRRGNRNSLGVLSMNEVSILPSRKRSWARRSVTS